MRVVDYPKFWANSAFGYGWQPGNWQPPMAWWLTLRSNFGCLYLQWFAEFLMVVFAVQPHITALLAPLAAPPTAEATEARLKCCPN